MPGRVVEVAVAAGDRVEPRSLLLVLEAMKMQNEIRCARGGLVTRVAVEAGKAVEGGALLAVVRQDAAGSSARTLPESSLRRRVGRRAANRPRLLKIQ